MKLEKAQMKVISSISAVVRDHSKRKDKIAVSCNPIGFPPAGKYLGIKAQ